MLNDNIAAISTPPGKGGVAIVRLSGGSPLSVADKMFFPAGKAAVKDFEPYRMVPGRIDGGSFSDFGLCVYFKAPHSFTGEDVVELHCHGGTGIARGILRRALSLGCRLAERGEFTKRAFLNGKLSLASAEGLIDMINGESEAEVRAGYSLYAEKLTRAVRGDIDFPEEDIEHTDLADVGARIGDIGEEIDRMLATYRTGKKIKEGVTVVLAGRPNTGKSSVLNALLGADKAIVSSVAGTTRDAVEGTLEIEGVRFQLIDTAGIRASADEVESVGIERARGYIERADLILFITDGAAPWSAEDEEVWQSVQGRRCLIVCNKNDLAASEEAGGPAPDLRVSARTGENIDALRKKIFDLCLAEYRADGEFLIEERHFAALTRAGEELRTAERLAGQVPLDLLGVHLKAAWEALGEISGETANERIIGEIFSKFCVGK